jgi:hypothetical protein
MNVSGIARLEVSCSLQGIINILPWGRWKKPTSFIHKNEVVKLVIWILREDV